MSKKGSRIVIATKNQGKLMEFKNFFSSDYITFLSLKDFPDIPKLVEDGKSFDENSAKKALTVSKQTGLLTIADDSGLEVDCLEGRPGIHSARFAGENATDEDNNKLLLKMLEGVKESKRTARFKASISAAIDGELLVTVNKACEGIILTSPKGSGGFGYDPLFYLKEAGKTMAELDKTEKNKISHRGKALKELVLQLKKLSPEMF